MPAVSTLPLRATCGILVHYSHDNNKSLHNDRTPTNLPKVRKLKIDSISACIARRTSSKGSVVLFMYRRTVFINLLINKRYLVGQSFESSNDAC